MTGAVLRIKIVPHKMGTGNDFRLAFWLPNNQEFEINDVESVGSFQDLCKALVEAATGRPPKDGTEKKIITIGGLPIKVSETDNDKKAIIKPKTAPDPTKEESQAAKEVEEESETTGISTAWVKCDAKNCLSWFAPERIAAHKQQMHGTTYNPNTSIGNGVNDNDNRAYREMGDSSAYS